VSHGHKLHFLVDIRADVSLVKSYKLLVTPEFEPEPKDRICVNSVQGPVTDNPRIFTEAVKNVYTQTPTH
jgi:hypothetical protein